MGRALVVVWADPGRSTGWSVHRVEEQVLLECGQVGAVSRLWWRTGVFRHDSTSTSVDSYLALCRAAWERSADGDVVVIGCEGFTLRMNSTDHWLLEPVRFLAVLRDRLRGTGVGVEVQSSSDAMKTVSDTRLRLWGLWKPGSDHSRDAQRHGLLFLRRYATQPELRERVGG